MSGRLKLLRNGRFCLDFEEQGISIVWTPGEAENGNTARRWVENHPEFRPLVPENVLRDLIGSPARFSTHARIDQKSVELPGQLDDGGHITISYFKGIPRRDLMVSEQEEGVETVKQWANSYLRNDI
jgi:hypothetical protein